MKRSTILVVALVIIFSFGSIALAGEQIELRLSGWVSSPAEEELVKEAISEYEAAHPNVKVKYEPIPKDYGTKIKTMLSARKAPDVFYVEMADAPAFMEKGLLYPMNDLMSESGTSVNDFLTPLLGAFTYDGQIYGIPKDFNTLALFYNKDMFAEAGVAVPTRDWTWDDLRDAARKLTKGTDNPATAQYGICLPADNARWLPFLYQNGGAVLSGDGTESVFNSPEAVEALDFYTSLQLKDGTSVKPSDVGAGWGGDAFGKEKAAMVLEGGWLIPYLDSSFPNVNYGAVELPQGPQGRGNLYFTVAYGIAATTKHPKEAWELVNHLTGVERQKKVLESGFALPTRKALENDPYFDANTNVKAIFDGYSYAKPYQFGTISSDVFAAISKALEKVFLGAADVQTAVSEADAAISKALKK